MSTVENNQTVWSNIAGETLDPKYEKCRNITEEIYKRINITFQIKKLEEQSDLSDQSEQIDSNELSNETDLFACDKTDSLPSSTEEKPVSTCDKFINNNNNEELKLKKAAAVCKRPRKRFRKRVKKRQPKPQSDSDGSSDEAVPLSRMVEVLGAGERPPSPERVMGVPRIVLVPLDMKPKISSPDRKSCKKPESKRDPKAENTIQHKEKTEQLKTIDNAAILDQFSQKDKGVLTNNCSMCSLSFRGERGLRRHMSMSHIISKDAQSPAEPRQVKPV